MILGDMHNMGRAVKAINTSYLLKPRPTIWEHLFLDRRSPLRAILDETGKFFYLPKLTIDPEYGFEKGGVVEKLVIDGPLEPGNLSVEFGEYVGALIAVSVWFGITDLHYQNIICGVKGAKPVIAPIDIECVLEGVALPSNTLLLHEDHKSQNFSGFCFLEDLTSICPATVCYGYLETLAALEEKSGDLNEVVRSFHKHKPLYSRVLLRSTHVYIKAMEKLSETSPKIPFLECEKLQMERGDIPYFFRQIDSQILYYIDDLGNFQRAECDPFRDKLNKLRMPNNWLTPSKDDFSLWIKGGILQVARRLKRASKEAIKSSEHNGLKLEFSDQFIEVSFRGLYLKGVFR